MNITIAKGSEERRGKIANALLCVSPLSSVCNCETGVLSVATSLLLLVRKVCQDTFEEVRSGSGKKIASLSGAAVDPPSTSSLGRRSSFVSNTSPSRPGPLRSQLVSARKEQGGNSIAKVLA